MKKKHFASRMHLGIGLQTFGNQTTVLATKEISLQVTEFGVLVRGKTSRKKALIPFANIKGIDFSSTSDFMDDDDVPVIIQEEKVERKGKQQ